MLFTRAAAAMAATWQKRSSQLPTKTHIQLSRHSLLQGKQLMMMMMMLAKYSQRPIAALITPRHAQSSIDRSLCATIELRMRYIFTCNQHPSLH